MALIGSAVLTFIGYKQTNKQTPKQTNRHPDKSNFYIDDGGILIFLLSAYVVHASVHSLHSYRQGYINVVLKKIEIMFYTHVQSQLLFCECTV